MKLMIVDDEPKIRKGLLKLLGAREGWQVSGVFEDAHSALTALYDQEADVIVTDIKMPEVSGLELIRQIRERNQEIRIVILSGHSNFAYAQKAIELGVTRYLLKPTNPRELIAVLEGIEKELEPAREEGTQRRTTWRMGIVSGIFWCKRRSGTWRSTTGEGSPLRICLRSCTCPPTICVSFLSAIQGRT